MTTTDQGWEILDEAAGLLTREYTFAPKSVARMITARMKDGRLAAISPGRGVPQEAMDELDDFGGVGAIVAPNGMHHLGVPRWHAAFPDALLYAPSAAMPRIAKKRKGLEVLPLDELVPLMADGVDMDEVPYFKVGETWIRASSSRGRIWYVTDSFISMEELPEKFLPRLAMKWTKSAPGFCVNGLGLKFFVKDRQAYRSWLLEKIDSDPPAMVVTAHGSIIERSDLGAELRGMVEARLPA